MDIGILAPTPTPFVMGGAEHLWLALQRYLNEKTGHNCELLKFNAKGRNLVEVLQTYLEPGRFELNHFDILLTTKDPAWFVEHHNHRIYLQHKLRGLYDTYHFCKEPEEEEPSSAVARQALHDFRRMALDDVGTRAAAPQIEKVIRAIEIGDIDARDARFPGPFAREIVHLLDGIAMSPGRIARYAAISNTVAKRANYFPATVKPDVVYHPPRLSDFRCQKPEHFFTVSRLDGPKRIDLIIREFRKVEGEVNLFIGGVGPATEELKQLAEGDDRIVFLGKMTDEQILDHYARSIAVPFVPYDEDYGLITVEAMMSGKPVLTVADSGGVTEIVRHGETGWCVPNAEGALADAFADALKDRRRTEEMGRAARESVRHITWESVASTLFEKAEAGPRHVALPAGNGPKANRKTLVVVTTFGIYPPRGGGQSRIFHLYAKLAQDYDVIAVCLVGSGEEFSDKPIASNFREIRIPKTEEHELAEAERSREVEWVPVTDIVCGDLLHLTPQFEEILTGLAGEANAVIASGPYLIDATARAMPSTTMLYEAHNLEIELKRDILPSTPPGQKLLDEVSRIESRCWRDAAMVFACAERDLLSLQNEYGSSAAIKIEVPNGYSDKETRFSPAAERKLLAKSLHPAMRKSALFLGSWHGPNLTAVEKILELAPLFDDVRFLLVGSACLAFKDREVPENVAMLGTVDEEEKALLLASASVALNPMTEGSGSNLKMLDYFGAGIPVISTLFGARGIDAIPGKHFIPAENDQLPLVLSEFFTSASGDEVMVCEAHRLALEKYSWDAIGNEFLDQLDHFFAPKKKAKSRS